MRKRTRSNPDKSDIEKVEEQTDLMQESRISEIQSEMQCSNLLATRLSPPWRFRFRFAVCTRPMQGLEDIRATESADLTHDIGVGIAEEIAERPRPSLYRQNS